MIGKRKKGGDDMTNDWLRGDRTDFPVAIPVPSSFSSSSASTFMVEAFTNKYIYTVLQFTPIVPKSSGTS